MNEPDNFLTPEMRQDMVRVLVHCVRFDSWNKTPVVLLKNETEDWFLPIWIGMFEATQIEIALEKVPVPRPMTHDLLNSLLTAFDLSLEGVYIHDISGGTFFACLNILKSEEFGGETVTLDSRPSDAIALALRTGSPIYVSRKIVREASINSSVPPDDEELQKFKNFVDSIKPGDFIE